MAYVVIYDASRGLRAIAPANGSADRVAAVGGSSPLEAAQPPT